MRLFLLLLTCCCFTGSVHAQSFIRLRNLQLGPTFSIQAKNQDGGIYDLAPIVKDPQTFPNRAPDGLKRKKDLLSPKVPAGAHINLLSTWDFNALPNMEWKIGTEYTTFEHVSRSYKTPFKLFGSPREFEQVSFRRKSQHMGLYTDLVFKKQISEKRATCFYVGAGGSLSYSISGKVEEKNEWTSVDRTISRDTAINYPTWGRRDIGLYIPVGFTIWGNRSTSRVGLNLGSRPGVVFIKEKNLPLFISPVMGFTFRLIYNLY